MGQVTGASDDPLRLSSQALQAQRTLKAKTLPRNDTHASPGSDVLQDARLTGNLTSQAQPLRAARAGCITVSDGRTNKADRVPATPHGNRLASRHGQHVDFALCLAAQDGGSTGPLSAAFTSQATGWLVNASRLPGPQLMPTKSSPASTTRKHLVSRRRTAADFQPPRRSFRRGPGHRCRRNRPIHSHGPLAPSCPRCLS